MGKRYYCDYCDRHFVDDLEARKKHLVGVMHMRLQKEYYDQFKDAETKYNEEVQKSICKRYQRFGDCAFGLNCRFTHYSWEELEALRKQVEIEKKPVIKNSTTDREPTLASWLEKRNKTEVLSSMPSSSAIAPWDTPTGLVGRLDLPPSLQPWKIEDFTFSEFDSWG